MRRRRGPRRGERRGTWAHKPRVISSPQPCSRQDRRTSGHSRRNSLEMAHDVGLTAALQGEVVVWARSIPPKCAQRRRELAVPPLAFSRNSWATPISRPRLATCTRTRGPSRPRWGSWPRYSPVRLEQTEYNRQCARCAAHTRRQRREQQPGEGQPQPAAESPTRAHVARRSRQRGHGDRWRWRSEGCSQPS
jgi:hypothetical protein